MHRFYHPDTDFSEKNISITDRAEIYHAAGVLRLKAGDKVLVFNGRNQQAAARITHVREERIDLAVDEVQEGVIPPCRIVLACAVPKKAKFEYIIEKCTELGVEAVVPLKTERTEVVFSAERSISKQGRFQKVAVNAAKQCGRLDIPKIYPMTPFMEALTLFDGSFVKIIPSLVRDDYTPLRSAITRAGGVVIFIGPEGDFTREEVQAAARNGALPVSLGNTVLKVDTAAIATVAMARFWCQ